MSETGSAAPSPLGRQIRETVSDAIGYWEPRRLVYNGVLALIVLGLLADDWPRTRDLVSLEGALTLFVLAVLANVCYCAAYVSDVFVQLSGYRETWHRWRWTLFLVGTAFAAVLTRWFTLGFVASPHGR